LREGPDFSERAAIVASKVVLVVDEDDGVRAEIRACLAQRQLSCREASTGRDALRAALDDPPDLILVDLVLPDQSGLGLCRMVRESPTLAATPIIVLTSRASEIDRVLAFESGVDDFLAKPFYPPELGARVSAVLRGFMGHAEEPASAAAPSGAIRLDPRTGRVTAGGRRIQLTPRERELLSALIAQAGRVVRRSQLIDRLQAGREPRSERAIDAHIKSIRRKLGPARTFLETVRGVGYRLAEHAVESGETNAFTQS
jgi:two-component system, OmpR family, phosphate regulon response regulator PhoB